MSTGEQQNFISRSSKTRIRLYFENHSLYILSFINLISKIIVVIGILTTIFSNHWAKSSTEPAIYSGYKNRCSVHQCTSNTTDPTSLVDLMCLLAIANLLMELINNSIIWFCHCRLSKIDILSGFMFILTFIITDCGVVFGIHIASYVYRLPMGYGYSCFILSIIFSIIDWGFSLKRLTADWPEIIYLTQNDSSHHHNPTALVVSNAHSTRILEEGGIASTDSNIYSDSEL